MFNEEGLLNKIVTAAVVGLLSWNVYTTQKLAVDVAVVKNSLDFSLRDIYTKSQATSDNRLLENRISALERWNQNQSDELRVLEETISRLLRDKNEDL